MVDDSPTVSGASSRALRYLPNNGLEQIADWLTKIIVGVSLIELQKIPPNVAALSLVISSSLGGSEEIRGTAYAMIIFFPIMGFLGMYISTRIDLNQRIKKSERDVFESSKVAVVDNKEATLTDPNRGVTAEVKSVATDIVSVPLESLTTPSDIKSWARAQAALREWDQAIAGYAKAVYLQPRDAKLRFDYAGAIYNSRVGSSEQVVEQLQIGLSLVDPSSDPTLAAQLEEGLMFAYLSVPDPTGFTNAIKIGDQFFASALPKDGAAYYYYGLATAAKYAWRKTQGANDAELADLKVKTIASLRQASVLQPVRFADMAMDLAKARSDAAARGDDLSLLNDPELTALMWPNGAPALDVPEAMKAPETTQPTAGAVDLKENESKPQA